MSPLFDRFDALAWWGDVALYVGGIVLAYVVLPRLVARLERRS